MRITVSTPVSCCWPASSSVPPCGASSRYPPSAANGRPYPVPDLGTGPRAGIDPASNRALHGMLDGGVELDARRCRMYRLDVDVVPTPPPAAFALIDATCTHDFARSPSVAPRASRRYVPAGRPGGRPHG